MIYDYTCIYNNHHFKLCNRQQPSPLSPLLHSIEIQPARKSRQTPRETNPIQLGAQASQPGPTLLEAGRENQLQTFLHTISVMLYVVHSRLQLIFKFTNDQGMTDRRSHDRRSEWRSLNRDREMIADLHFKKDRKVIAIAKFVDRDLAIARS